MSERPSWLTDEMRREFCYDENGKHNGPCRNGCCCRGLMGVGMGCNDCPALDDKRSAGDVPQVTE